MRRFLHSTMLQKRAGFPEIYGRCALSANENFSAAADTTFFDANYNVVTNVGGWWDSSSVHGIVVGFDCVLQLNFLVIAEDFHAMNNIIIKPLLGGSAIFDYTNVTSAGSGAGIGWATPTFTRSFFKGNQITMGIENPSAATMTVYGAANNKTQVWWQVLRKI